ncbi:MAG: porin [Gallionella sp.]
MMKKTLLVALTLGAASGAAYADGEVSVYGILDVGVVGLTHTGNFSPNFVTSAVPTGAQPVKTGTAVGMMTGGESQTRFGLKGSEDMGNGNKAFFQLESAFNLGSGTLATSGLAGAAGTAAMVADTSLNGQLFNRMALVGISNDDLGAVSLGRQNSLQLNIITGGYDPVNAQMFSPINFSGAYGGGGATDNARVDNAVKYAKKFGNNINVNALYGFGGVASNMAARSNLQLNAGYEADNFGVQAALQTAKDTTSISANALPNTVNAQFINLTSYMLAGRWQVIDPLTLKAGYEREQINAPGNPTGDLAMTQIYSYQAVSSVYANGQKSINVYWLGGNYQFTPAIKASLGFYDAKTPAYGTAPVADADDKYYSAFVEYSVTKSTNVYAGLMMDKKSGAAVAVGAPDTFSTYGAGLRHMF